MSRLCGKLKAQVKKHYFFAIIVHDCINTRYFGSAEGSKFVEAGSVENVKRTWVDYGIPRDWTQPTQGQVCVCVCVYVRICV